MKKRIAIFGLGWQGQQFLKYFLRTGYNTIGICKTQETQKKIQDMYGITVYTNYKDILNDNIDILVLAAYPIDIYEKVIEYSKNFNYQILSDLPITFDINQLNNYISDQNIYFFLQETELFFFKNYILNKEESIMKVDCLLLQNKENLIHQEFKKKSLVVDTQYMFNNILGIGFDKINIHYKFVKKKIKNIEYIIQLYLQDGNKVIYKYEDGKGISIYFDNSTNSIKKYVENIVFDEMLNKYMKNIFIKDNKLKQEYKESFNYILNMYKYE